MNLISDERNRDEIPGKTNAVKTSNLGEVVRQYSERLFGFIRKRVRNDEDAEDLLHDVWQQLAAQPEIEAIDHISGWLHRVARNKIIDRSRTRHEDLYENIDHEVESLELEPFLVLGSSPEDAYANQAMWEALTEALRQLPHEQRRAFVENEFEGRTLRELAEESDVSIKTMISRKNYAVQSLRKSLFQWYEDLNMDAQ